MSFAEELSAHCQARLKGLVKPGILVLGGEAEPLAARVLKRELPCACLRFLSLKEHDARTLAATLMAQETAIQLVWVCEAEPEVRVLLKKSGLPAALAGKKGPEAPDGLPCFDASAEEGAQALCDWTLTSLPAPCRAAFLASTRRNIKEKFEMGLAMVKRATLAVGQNAPRAQSGSEIPFLTSEAVPMLSSLAALWDIPLSGVEEAGKVAELSARLCEKTPNLFTTIPGFGIVPSPAHASGVCYGLGTAFNEACRDWQKGGRPFPAFLEDPFLERAIEQRKNFDANRTGYEGSESSSSRFATLPGQAVTRS